MVEVVGGKKFTGGGLKYLYNIVSPFSSQMKLGWLVISLILFILHLQYCIYRT